MENKPTLSGRLRIWFRGFGNAGAKALLDAGDRAGCAEEILRHFRTRQAPRYLFTADDLRALLCAARSRREDSDRGGVDER